MSTRKTTVVVTTINAPSVAMNKWRELVTTLERCSLVVIGDVTTPDDAWRSWTEGHPRCEYVSWVQQQNTKLGVSLPERHYSRKNYGYAIAHARGSDVFETDDDNEPCDEVISVLTDAPRHATTWPVRETAHEGGWFNAYEHNGWPRGFPLPYDPSVEVPTRAIPNPDVEARVSDVLVTQYLHKGEPDFDAVGRLSGRKGPFSPGRAASGFTILTQGCYAPVNSQATWWRHDALEHAYLPTRCAGRASDILRGYVLVRMLWNRVMIGPACVRQDRNPHDVVNDLREEVGFMRVAPYLHEVLRDASTVEDCFKQLYVRGAWCGGSHMDELHTLEAYREVVS